MRTARRSVLTIIMVVVATTTYLVTHFVRLEDFPVYFLFDEAVQACLADDYVASGFHGPEGERFPTFFPVAWDASISTSVYLQILAIMVAGARSIWLSRLVSALVGCLLPISLAWALRSVFRVRWWWLGILVAAAIPTWFLHARTALATPFLVSFYALMVAAYLRFRTGSPWLIYLSVCAGGLAFYSYGAGQVVVPATAAALVLSSARYHLRLWRHSLAAALLFVVILSPAVVFRIRHPQLLDQQLAATSSSLLSGRTWQQRVGAVAAAYGTQINPAFWFFDHEQLSRHRMLGYGHLSLWMLPFFVVGLGRALWQIRDVRYRIVVVALAVAPVAGAIAAPSVGRGMVMIVPAALLVSIGLNDVLAAVMRTGRAAAAPIVVATCIVAYCGYMLGDALYRGPTWYSDYGLYGQQWGARELFARAIPDYLAAHPRDVVSVSADWANGADIFPRFFGSPPQVTMGGIRPLVEQRYNETPLPLDETMVFVAEAEALPSIRSSARFATLRTVYTLTRPDGQPGFVFLKATYRPDLPAVLAKEVIERRKPVPDTVTIDKLGNVAVLASRADLGSIQAAFDGDSHSVVRGLEANPFVVEISIAGKGRLHGLRVECAAAAYRVTAVVTGAGADAGRRIQREVEVVRLGDHTVALIEFESILAATVRLEILDTQAPAADPAHVHLYEVGFLWDDTP